MRRFFKRRKASQSLEGVTTDGPITQIDRVGGNVTVVVGQRQAPPAPPEFEAARERYAARVRQRYGRLDLEVLTPLREQDEHPVLHLRDVFVPQSVRADPPPVELPQELLRRLMDPAEAELHDLPPGIDRETVDRVRRAYRERPPLPVLDVLGTPEHDRVVLLGNPGSGKSTLARYLTLALTAPEPPPNLDALSDRLPLIVELREYAQPAWRERTFEDFLAHQYATEGLGLPPETLTALLSGEGPYTALVVFDGLDELFEKDVRDAVARRVAGFAARHPRTRIVVTSRGYGYQRAVLDGAGFTNFMLQDLDREQIGAFAEQWFSLACPDDPTRAGKLIERVTTAVDASTSVRELAGNPLILTILAIIGRRRELPRDRRTVYEHAVDVLVEHWDPSKYLKDRQVEEHLPYLGPEDKRELLRLIARQMQEGHGGISGNHIAGPDLLKSFEEYLRDRYALPPDRAATAARVMLDQFRHRNFVLSRYGGEIYGFVHRTFLEYLAATDLAHRFNQERSLSETDLQDLFADKVHDPTWHEILLLLVGLLDERFVAGVIDRLLGAREIAEPLGGYDDRSFGEVLFTARCLAEVRRLGALVPQSRAMVRTLIRLFELAEALEVSFFHPYDNVGALGPALLALGGDWAGREDYLRWFEGRRTSVEHGGDELLTVNSTRQLTTDIFLFLGAPEGVSRVAYLAEMVEAGRTPWERIGATRLLLSRAGDRDAFRRDTFRSALARCVREDASPGVRAEVLGHLEYDAGTDSAWLIRLAVESLARDPSPRVRRIALGHLARHRHDNTEARAAFEGAAEDSRPDVREQARHLLLARSGGDAPPMALVREALHDADPALRLDALLALERIAGDDPDARALVYERLVNDESSQVVARAINVVRSIGSDDPGTHVLLRGLSEHEDSEVREAALRCLVEEGDVEEALSELLRHRLAHDEDHRVRSLALTLTVQLQDDDTTKRALLLNVLRNDPSPENQTRALTVLCELDPKAARDLLVDRCENHPEEDVRGEASYWLLQQYGDDPEVVDLVLDRAAHDESSEARFLAFEALLERHSRNPEVAALAQDRFDHDPFPKVRRIAFGVLADLRRDDPEFLPLLRRATEDEAPEIRDLANRLLTVLAPQAP
ncbi:HEAT repeat domain-containing protein [Streptomyces sp. NPDC056528]|uniref:HEAT repeat domain-containing protein n=1 Tax=Streptomyces sp. NPDC056528 TaxID=3345854 RepID=UPI00367D0DA0